MCGRVNSLGDKRSEQVLDLVAGQGNQLVRDQVRAGGN
jgi:hypothetical protein